MRTQLKQQKVHFSYFFNLDHFNSYCKQDQIHKDFLDCVLFYSFECNLKTEKLLYPSYCHLPSFLLFSSLLPLFRSERTETRRPKNTKTKWKMAWQKWMTLTRMTDLCLLKVVGGEEAGPVVIKTTQNALAIEKIFPHACRKCRTRIIKSHHVML